MATRYIRPLPPQLTRLLFDLGPRKLVLVEGSDDVEVFRIWYHDRLSQVDFYPAEGYSSVEIFLNEILNYSITKQAYGLIDRDFRDEVEIETKRTDPNTHLFILRRYALENYLLEPAAVFDELEIYFGEKFHINDVTAMEQSLLDLCRRLKSVMAANWVFWDKQITGKYFPKGYQVDDRPQLIRQVADRLECLEPEAEQRVAEKELFLDMILTQLDLAHTRINGKHLLEQLYREYQIRRDKSHFRRLLARTIRQKGLPLDIQEIVEHRILS